MEENDAADSVIVQGAMVQWQPVTLEVSGPATSEEAAENPFLDYRLDATIRHDASGRSFVVPGYFAADGNAAESGAAAGAVWQVRFLPDEGGAWTYKISFRRGRNVAVAGGPTAGRATVSDGSEGTFAIAPADTSAPGFYARGPLRYVGQRYLRFEDGTYFLKGGADSPENFLAYHDFDGTYSVKQPGKFQAGEAHTAPLHRYEPHIRDWSPQDPSWRSGRGKGILGALNYLASKGMNSVYFLTMNVEGDGSDVWPWIAPDVMDRFDVSKLDQWNVVFDHMDRLGIAMHVVLTETENESFFERYADSDTDFAESRKLYYREFVARFAHHPALVWNLGEENGWDDTDKATTGPSGLPNTDAQRKAFAAYLQELDPYDHPIVVHTLPGRYAEIYEPLLGFPALQGPSLQMGNVIHTHTETLEWVRRSTEAGLPWVVTLDEIGPADEGVRPDASAEDDHHRVRYHGLWGNLMAGGGGVEWYFGYEYPHNDLSAEDWRSRDRMWDYTRHALTFFRTHLPFWDMRAVEGSAPDDDHFTFAREGDVYAVYLPYGVARPIDLPNGRYRVQWYSPRDGGPLQSGAVAQVNGGPQTNYGSPPAKQDEDWVVLIRRSR